MGAILDQRQATFLTELAELADRRRKSRVMNDVEGGGLARHAPADVTRVDPQVTPDMEEPDAGSGGEQGVQLDAMEECRKQHLATPEPQCLRDREDPITGEGEGAPAGIGAWEGHP